MHIAANELKKGSSVKECITLAEDHLARYQEIKLEYLQSVNLKDLRVVETANGSDHLVLCFAGYIDNIRLIDNLIINS